MKHFILIIFCCFPFLTIAQTIIGNINLFDANQQHLIKTIEGDEVLGKIVAINESEITLKFKGNELKFKREELVSIEVAGAVDKTENNYNKLFQTGEEGTKIADKPIEGDTIRPFPIGDIVSPEVDLENRLQKQIVTTKRGDRFVGRILNIGRTVEMKTVSGFDLTFTLEEIEKIGVYGQKYEFKESKNGDYIIVKPMNDLEAEGDYILAQNRMFISQTGFGLKGGETEYRNTELFMNEVNHGFSDNFSMGVGVIPFFTVNFLTANIKFTFDANDYLHFGMGTQTLFGFSFEDFTDDVLIFTPFVSMSIGSEKGFMNFSYNYWTFDGIVADLYGIGFSLKSGERFRLYADVFITDERDFDENVSFVMMGGSWYNAKNKVDFGIGVIPNDGLSDVGFIPFPMAGFTRRF